jgi:hypothetical protein
MWGEVTGVVVEVRGGEREIGRGRGFTPPNSKYRACVLGIAWPLKIRGGCRGYMWDGADMRIKVVGGRGEEIGWGWGLYPKI